MDEALPRSFFTRPVLELAPALLGTELVRIADEGIASGIIVEVEAYRGPEDRAAHSYGGRRTNRTEVMFGDGGYAYVYQIYGMYFCFNVVAAGPGQPEAVLVRAVEPVLGIELMAARRGVELDGKSRWWEEHRGSPPPASIRRLTDGPGKLCQALDITRGLNGHDLTQSPLFIRRGISPVPARDIATGPRINVDYAGSWAHKEWRFWIRGNPFVSGRPAQQRPQG